MSRCHNKLLIVTAVLVTMISASAFAVSPMCSTTIPIAKLYQIYNISFKLHKIKTKGDTFAGGYYQAGHGNDLTISYLCDVSQASVTADLSSTTAVSPTSYQSKYNQKINLNNRSSSIAFPAAFKAANP